MTNLHNSNFDNGAETSYLMTPELNSIAIYQQLKSKMKPSGIASLVFGFIAFLSGLINTASGSFISLILVFLGLLLLIDGFWLLISPRALALVIDGIAIFAVGSWNFVTSAFIAIAGHSDPGIYFFLILGILQLGWGFKSIKAYYRFKDASLIAEDPNILQKEATRIAQLLSSDKYSDVWIARTEGKYRPMQYKERQLPLDNLMLMLLKGELNAHRTLLCHSGDQTFKKLNDFPVLVHLIEVLFDET